MKKIASTWWIPTFDNSFEKELDSAGQYQKNNRDYTLTYVKDFNSIAIDVGANIGFWSLPLSKRFTQVHAFEPFDLNAECFKQNLESRDNVVLHEVALSNIAYSTDLYISAKSCGHPSLDPDNVTKGGSVPIQVKTLDSYQFKNVGYIKVDVQGTEKNVVLGAIDTLVNNDVTIVLELPVNPSRKHYQKELTYHREISAILKDIGYNLHGQFKKEAVFCRGVKE
jgi:FkbM family methyltransferase